MSEPMTAAQAARLAQWQVNTVGRALLAAIGIGVFIAAGMPFVDKPGYLLPLLVGLPVLTLVVWLAFAKPPRM